MRNDFDQLIRGTFRIFVEASSRQKICLKYMYAHKQINKLSVFRIQSSKCIKYLVNYFSADFLTFRFPLFGSFSAVAGLADKQKQRRFYFCFDEVLLYKVTHMLGTIIVYLNDSE